MIGINFFPQDYQSAEKYFTSALQRVQALNVGGRLSKGTMLLNSILASCFKSRSMILMLNPFFQRICLYLSFIQVKICLASTVDESGAEFGQRSTIGPSKN
jgi:hypothetical protein